MDHRLIKVQWMADEKYKELEFAVVQLQSQIKQVYARKKVLKRIVIEKFIIFIITFLVLELFFKNLMYGIAYVEGFRIILWLLIIIRIGLQTYLCIQIFNRGIPLIKNGIVSAFQPSVLGNGYTLYDELAKCNVHLANSKADLQKIKEIQDKVEDMQSEKKWLTMSEENRENICIEAEVLLGLMHAAPEVPTAISSLSGKFVLFKVAILGMLNICFTFL